MLNAEKYNEDKKMNNFAFSDTFVEITILNYLENCTHFKWIARDQDGCLCVYDKKPHKEKKKKKLTITLAMFTGIEAILSRI